MFFSSDLFFPIGFTGHLSLDLVFEGLNLGPPFYRFFLGWPPKIDYRKKKIGCPHSNLSSGGPRNPVGGFLWFPSPNVASSPYGEHGRDVGPRLHPYPPKNIPGPIFSFMGKTR